MIISLDPSFSSTGISVHQDDGSLITTMALHHGGKVFQGNDQTNKTCYKILKDLKEFLSTLTIPEGSTIVCEYPAPTSSGFYLAMLHGWLMNYFYHDTRFKTIVTIPPMACNSFTGNKQRTKTHIVNFVKERHWVPDKRINNDICTAVVLAHIYLNFRKGLYKNKVFISTRRS